MPQTGERWQRIYGVRSVTPTPLKPPIDVPWGQLQLARHAGNRKFELLLPHQAAAPSGRCSGAVSGGRAVNINQPPQAWQVQLQEYAGAVVVVEPPLVAACVLQQ